VVAFIKGSVKSLKPTGIFAAQTSFGIMVEQMEKQVGTICLDTSVIE
jgi:hypothetical protein